MEQYQKYDTEFCNLHQHTSKGMARLLSELTHFKPVNNIPEKLPPVIVDRPPLAITAYERTPRRPV
jgi:hypothetical protein